LLSPRRHADLHRRRVPLTSGRDRHQPEWAAEGFNDLDEDVRQSIRRIKASPFIPRKNVRGFIYDVATWTLREVEA
jgi:carbonic anhydrase